MENYTVMWTIDVEAASATDAAKQARKIQQDPENIATVFEVMKTDTVEAIVKGFESIDLLDEEEN